MIVYGDPQITKSGRDLLHEIQEFASQTNFALDDWRTILIKAGQLEQGIADSPKLHPAGACVGPITDCAARNFVRLFINNRAARSGAELAELCHYASKLMAPDDDLTIKVPEGFSFYALYPEQYLLATQKWMGRHPDAASRPVLVVGIRSIGTALSAVVAETLRESGWTATRVTVRPHGHPFQRQVDLPSNGSHAAAFALVVDEGPGLSGSSMAAVADVLGKQGVTPSQIAFLPAHANEPGHAASSSVRRWWSQVERVVCGLDELRWQGKNLLEALSQRTEGHCGAQVIAIENVSGGRWRHHAYRGEDDWPSANLPFEREKYLCTLSNSRRVLWKFEGFMTTRRTFSPAPIQRVPMLDHFRGFAAQPWIEGERLTARSSNTMAPQIGSYIGAVAASPLTCSESVLAVERLGHLLYWNTRETLGEDAAARVHELTAHAREFVANVSLPSYGDGRIAPHEFVRASDGTIHKTDHYGHDMDHTAVGKQSVLWDVAGAIVEWRMSNESAAEVLRASGAKACEPVLRFYCAAYSAFRLGMLATIQDAAEDSRARFDRERYSEHLERGLHRVASLPAS
jgi:hypothetical protein